MASFEDQLAIYRQQLVTASAPVGGPSVGQTASLAFNTVMADLRGLAAMVQSTPSTPQISNIQQASSYYQPSFASAAIASSGMVAPPINVNAGEYRNAATNYASTVVGDAVGSASMGFAAVGGAAVAGIGMNTAYHALFSPGATYAAAKVGAKVGASMLGAAGTAVAGTAVGGTVGVGVGAAAGAVGGAILPLLPAAAAWYAGEEAVSAVYENVSARGQMRDYMQQSSWRYTGGKGFSRGERTTLSRDLANIAIDDRDFGYGDIQNILKSGTELGMFNGVSDISQFKEKFKELKEGVKAVSKALKVSLDEGLQVMSEIKQGGFYGGHAQAGAMINSAGMGHASGYSAREMHEVGMRGAAMFRGTGIDTKFGYEMSQMNLAAVSQLQRSGSLTDENINQMGGKVASAAAITQASGQFMHSGVGRSVGALLIGKGSEVLNEDVFNRVMSGDSISDILGSADVDFNKVNSRNTKAAISALGPQRWQMMTSQLIANQAKEYQVGRPGLEFRDAFDAAAKSFGINNDQNINALFEFRKNAPDIFRAQANAIDKQIRTTAMDEFRRRNTLWERTGAGGVMRSLGSAAGSVGDVFVDAGSAVSRGYDAVGMYIDGTEYEYDAKVDEGLILASAINEIKPSRMRRGISSEWGEALRSQGAGYLEEGRQSDSMVRSDGKYYSGYLVDMELSNAGAAKSGIARSKDKSFIKSDKYKAARGDLADQFSKALGVIGGKKITATKRDGAFGSDKTNGEWIRKDRHGVEVGGQYMSTLSEMTTKVNSGDATKADISTLRQSLIARAKKMKIDPRDYIAAYVKEAGINKEGQSALLSVPGVALFDEDGDKGDSGYGSYSLVGLATGGVAGLAMAVGYGEVKLGEVTQAADDYLVFIGADQEMSSSDSLSGVNSNSVAVGEMITEHRSKIISGEFGYSKIRGYLISKGVDKKVAAKQASKMVSKRGRQALDTDKFKTVFSKAAAGKLNKKLRELFSNETGVSIKSTGSTAALASELEGLTPDEIDSLEGKKKVMAQKVQEINDISLDEGKSWKESFKDDKIARKFGTKAQLAAIVEGSSSGEDAKDKLQSLVLMNEVNPEVSKKRKARKDKEDKMFIAEQRFKNPVLAKSLTLMQTYQAIANKIAIQVGAEVPGAGTL